MSSHYIKGGVPEFERATGRFSKTDFKNRDMVYALETNVGFAGASCSRFKTGMHCVVLVASGIDHKGKKFCVVFDPDVTATEKSRDKWLNLPPNVKDQDQPADDSVIETMILGEGDHLGPLVRYYYY